MTSPRWEDRLLAFVPGTAWKAPAPKRPPVRVAPLAWIPTGNWNLEERVALGLTSHGTTAFLSAVSLLHLVRADAAVTGPLAVEGALVHANRCRIVEQFLIRPELGRYLLLVDGDMVVEPTVARALVTVAEDLELDVVSQCYPTLVGSGTCEAAVTTTAAHGIDDVEEPEWGTVVEVDFVGFGCVLIRRSLLVRLEDELHDEGRDAAFCPLPDRPAWGEDYAWCARARGIGARIATANVARVRHLKTVPLALATQASLPALDDARKEG